MNTGRTPKTSTAKPRIRWTPTLLRALFEALVQRFGPFRDWSTPRPDGLDAFCESFAATFGASNGDAVRLTIEDAVRNPEAPRGNNAATYALRKAAAMEMGFLTRAEAWPAATSDSSDAMDGAP